MMAVSNSGSAFRALILSFCNFFVIRVLFLKHSLAETVKTESNKAAFSSPLLVVNRSLGSPLHAPKKDIKRF